MDDLHMYKEMQKSWGRRVRAARETLGVSQERLAEICGIAGSTISRIESGERDPSNRVQFLIAGALGRTVEELFPTPPVRPPYPGADQPEGLAS